MGIEKSLIKSKFKFYKLIMVLFLVSFIPLINLSNKVVVGLLFSIIILIFNFQRFSKEDSRVKLVLTTFAATVIYYVLAIGQRLLVSINIINEVATIGKFTNENIDLDFALVNGQLLLVFIPLSITSLILMKRDKLDDKTIKVAVIINMILFVISAR